MIHCGTASSKYDRTGPSAPATSPLLQVLNKDSSHCLVGNSSSSMNATKSPVAFSIVLFRASAMFCWGSTQYMTLTFEVAAKLATTDSAVRKLSLSAIIIEYVNKNAVS